MTKSARPPFEIAQELASFLEAYQGTQRELAEMAGVSQSTISRALKDKGRSRVSNGLQKLCIYAGICVEKTEAASHQDPSTSIHLMEALHDVWDGTDKHAKALAKVIKSLKSLHSQQE